MTTERTDAAIERAFARTTKVLDAIEGGDLEAKQAIDEMTAAQPWDLVAIGQGFVLDQLETERDEDDKQPTSKGSGQS